MTKKQVKDVFKTGDGMYISNSFSERFNDEPLGEISGKLKIYTLEKKMSDDKILEKINKKTCTFADIHQALQDEKQLLKKGYAKIFYVNGKAGEIFAVLVYWYSGDREWSVYCWSLSERCGWDAGSQVLCPVNADHGKLSPDTLTLIPSDTLKKAWYVKEIEKKIKVCHESEADGELENGRLMGLQEALAILKSNQ